MENFLKYLIFGIFFWPFMQIYYCIKSLITGQGFSAMLWVRLVVAVSAIMAVILVFNGAEQNTIGRVFINILAPIGVFFFPFGIYDYFKGYTPETGHVRGASLMTKKDFKAHEKSMSTEEKAAAVRIGNVPIPFDLEPLSFIIAGGPGTGKSMIIKDILSTLRARGDIVICADPGGDMMSLFYKDNDVILNPLDSRSVPWSPLAEPEAEWEAARLARAIVPDGEGQNSEWTSYSQSLVTAVFQKLGPTATTGDLLDALTVMPNEKLERLVAGTAASRMFSPGSSKMLDSVRSIISTELTPWTYLDRTGTSKSWSIRQFVSEQAAQQIEDNQQVNWLWLPYRSNQRALLRPLLGAWLDLVSTSVMQLDPNSSRRIWLVADELPALRKVGSLTESLAEGRKFGLVCLAGLQSIPQLREIYGQEGSKSLLSCFQNVVTLRVTDTDTAEYMSEKLGEGEFEEEKISKSESDGKDSKTTSIHREKKRIVMPAEIKKLPNLHGFLDIAGPIPVCPIVVPVVQLEAVTEPFIQKLKTPPSASSTSQSGGGDKPNNDAGSKRIELEI